MKSWFERYNTLHFPLIRLSIALMLLMVSVSAMAQSSFVFKAHGVFGFVSGCTPDKCFFVQVGTNKISDLAILEYSVHDIATGDEFNGFGQIPMSAITGNGTTTLAVNVDTSKILDYSLSLIHI